MRARPISVRVLALNDPAAGPLLPSVAIQLRAAFPGAAVLTSYGMTECMPITCPPPDYGLERAGSSGQPICPDLAIVDDAGNKVPNGCVAGAYTRPLFCST